MNRRSSVLIVVLCGVLGATALRGQTTPSSSLLILAKTDLTMAIVDPATLTVVARVPAGPDPHEVIVSPDGALAYVSNYGRGSYNTLTPIDLRTRQPLTPVDLGPFRGPHGLAFAGGKLWFTSEVAKALARYDPATKQIDAVVGVGQNRIHMLVATERPERVIATNVNSASVSFVERTPGPGGAAAGDWDVTTVPAGRGVEGLDLSPDGTTIWAGNATDGTVSVIDVASKRVETIAANVTGVNRVKFTPDGTRVFITGALPAAVVFDAATRREIARVPVGRGAAGILMQPDGTRVFIACSPDDYVAVVDLKTLEVVGRIDAGRQPDGMAWAGH